MLLVIDVGNTNTVIGVYNTVEKPNRPPLHHWRLETKKERTADELGIFFKELFHFANIEFHQISGIIISSVVPQLDFNLERMAERYFKQKPLFVTPKLKMPLKIGVAHPEEVGADRIVNGVAGIIKYGTPLLIVDFGTATTFDFINKGKSYRGGCIVPGIAISNAALFEHASKLPRVEIKRPKNIIGKNTVESIQAGIFYGYVGMVDGIVKNMLKEAKVKCPVIATGGFISLITQASKTITKADPFLTLEGLRVLYEYNCKKK